MFEVSRARRERSRPVHQEPDHAPEEQQHRGASEAGGDPWIGDCGAADQIDQHSQPEHQEAGRGQNPSTPAQGNRRPETYEDEEQFDRAVESIGQIIEAEQRLQGS